MDTRLANILFGGKLRLAKDSAVCVTQLKQTFVVRLLYYHIVFVQRRPHVAVKLKQKYLRLKQELNVDICVTELSEVVKKKKTAREVILMHNNKVNYALNGHILLHLESYIDRRNRKILVAHLDVIFVNEWVLSVIFQQFTIQVDI